MATGEVKDQTPEGGARRARVLREDLAYHEHRFFVLESPLISKAEYWRQREELLALERAGIARTPDSASWRDGSESPPPSSQPRPTGPHARPFIVAEEVASERALRGFFDKVERADPRTAACVGRAWLAGVEVALDYRDGLLVGARLRDDGTTGREVLDCVRRMGSVPLRLRPAGSITESRVTRVLEGGAGPSTLTPVPPAPTTLTIHGTITMPVLDFLATDRRRVDAGEPPYLGVAPMIEAALGHPDCGVSAALPLCFFAEDVIESIDECESHWQILGALKSWGFRVTSLAWRCEGPEEALDFVGTLQRERPRFEFPLEGGVLTKNRRIGARLDARLVFQTRGRDVHVARVYEAVGRSGSLFPVAILDGPKGPDPVPVPALNASALPRIQAGMTVRVVGGAIAPRIVVGSKTPVSARPTNCPGCDGPVRARTDNALEPFAECPNPACPGRLRARLLHMTGPRGLGLVGVHPDGAEQWARSGGRITLVDVLRASTEALDRLAPGQGEAARATLDRTRSLPLWKVLAMVSIPGVGERAARVIAGWAGDLDVLERATAEDLENIPELDPPTRKALMHWLEQEGRGLLHELKEIGVDVVGSAGSFPAPFYGRRVFLAGRFEPVGQERALDVVERLGARLVPRVTRTTDLVILGADAEEAAREAELYGTPIIDAQTLHGFFRRLGLS